MRDLIVVSLILLVSFNGCANANRGLIEASAKGDTTKVKYLLKKGANPNYNYWVDNCVGNSGTPLTNAAQNGQYDAAKILLENGAKTDCFIDNETPSALEYAAWFGHYEVVKLLVENGANIGHSKRGSTPLMYASMESVHRKSPGVAKEIIFYLIGKGSDINARNKYGWTAAMFAAESKDKEATALEILIEKGADITLTSNDGETVLMRSAAWGGDRNIIRYLIGKGADVNAKTSKGMTVLMYAAESNNLDAMRALIEAGADANSQDGGGKTALGWLRHNEKPNPDAVRLLLEHNKQKQP